MKEISGVAESCLICSDNFSDPTENDKGKWRGREVSHHTDDTLKGCKVRMHAGCLSDWLNTENDTPAQYGNDDPGLVADLRAIGMTIEDLYRSDAKENAGKNTGCPQCKVDIKSAVLHIDGKEKEFNIKNLGPSLEDVIDDLRDTKERDDYIETDHKTADGIEDSVVFHNDFEDESANPSLDSLKDTEERSHSIETVHKTADGIERVYHNFFEGELAFYNNKTVKKIIDVTGDRNFFNNPSKKKISVHGCGEPLIPGDLYTSKGLQFLDGSQAIIRC